MLARSRRLCLFSSLTSPVRSSTSAAGSGSGAESKPAEKPQDSIFAATESPWDHVFSDLEPVAPVSSPAQRRIRARLNNGASASPKNKNKPNLVQRSSGVRRQRASITAREMSVFDEMFDLIFDAVSARDGSGAQKASAPTPSIGRTGAQLNDVFRTLRRRTRWTTAIDEELDRKKETMELFGTDHDLLVWVTQEVFGDADEEAGSKGKEKDSDSPKGMPRNHSIYPHLIAHAMRIFRTTYSNPSLSLAIFNHASRASIPSYVFGCTAPAYNELMEAKWEGWGDLEGVCGALEEMRANGVKIDGRTRIVVERVRREVGEARESSADVNPLARRAWVELGEAEVMRLVHRIEQLALRERTRKSTRASPHEETWKSAVLESESGEDDGWVFDRWEDKAFR